MTTIAVSSVAIGLVQWKHVPGVVATLAYVLTAVFLILALRPHKLDEFNPIDVQETNQNRPVALALYQVKESKLDALTRAQEELKRVSRWLNRAYFVLIFFVVPFTILTIALETTK